MKIIQITRLLKNKLKETLFNKLKMKKKITKFSKTPSPMNQFTLKFLKTINKRKIHGKVMQIIIIRTFVNEHHHSIMMIIIIIAS